MFPDDNPTGETFVVCLDLQGSLPAVQGILLDKVYVIHTHNLRGTGETDRLSARHVSRTLMVQVYLSFSC